MALTMLGLSACVKTGGDFVAKFEKSVLANKDNGQSTVSVSSVTDFEWDRLFIFSPYTPVERIHAQLGYEWAEADKTGIQSSDTFFLLVFTKDGKVTSFFKFPRGIGDFKNLESGNVYSHEDDTFEIKSDEKGHADRLVLVPKHKRAHASAINGSSTGQSVTS
jgi:hypothetical protein